MPILKHIAHVSENEVPIKDGQFLMDVREGSKKISFDLNGERHLLAVNADGLAELLERAVAEVAELKKLKEQIEQLPRPDLVNSPHLWPANQEIDLGDGSYGCRATGTITCAANNTIGVSFTTIPLNCKLIASGGWWNRGDGNIASTGSSLPGSNVQSAIWLTRNFHSLSNNTRNNSPYDIWIRYSK